MSNIVWMVVLTLCTCAIILSAAIGEPSIVMAMSAGISFSIAVLAIRELQALEEAGASRRAIKSAMARFMGLVWIWGALGLVVSYGLILSGTWPNWWIFFIAFAAAGVLCLFYSTTLDRDEALQRDDDMLTGLGRPIIILQLTGMLVTMAWLATNPSQNLLTTESPSWVANNIFFGGAIALTAICAYALLHVKSEGQSRKPAAA
jgi:hypothetical protein